MLYAEEELKMGLAHSFKNYPGTDYCMIILYTATMFIFSTLIHHLG